MANSSICEHPVSIIHKSGGVANHKQDYGIPSIDNIRDNADTTEQATYFQFAEMKSLTNVDFKIKDHNPDSNNANAYDIYMMNFSDSHEFMDAINNLVDSYNNLKLKNSTHDIYSIKIAIYNFKIKYFLLLDLLLKTIDDMQSDIKDSIQSILAVNPSFNALLAYIGSLYFIQPGASFTPIINRPIYLISNTVYEEKKKKSKKIQQF